MRKLILALSFLAAPAAQAATMSASTTAPIPLGGLLGVTFELGTGASFLDITTNGSTNAGGGAANTFVALFAGTGSDAALIASDDADGDLGRSFLRFGNAPPGLAQNPSAGFFDNAPFASDGAAPGVGTYTLIVLDSPRPGFTAPAALGGFGSETGDQAIDLRVSLFSDASIQIVGTGPVTPVPLPAAGGMLAVALAAFGLRRRRARRAG